MSNSGTSSQTQTLPACLRSTSTSWRRTGSPIDLADRRPQRLTLELAQQADVVVTMGCGDECPYIPGKRYIDWELQDPAGQPLEEVRVTRDEIARRVGALIDELGT